MNNLTYDDLKNIYDGNKSLNGKPIFIKFKADWWGPCRIFGQLLDKVTPDYSDKIDFYKVDVDKKSRSMNIVWEQNIDKNGKPLSGLMIYERGNIANSIIPFDKDKLVVVELSNGSITDELPFKDGVQSLPVLKNDYIYFVDKENKFRSYSLIDRSQKLCFDLKEMKGCDWWAFYGMKLLWSLWWIYWPYFILYFQIILG